MAESGGQRPPTQEEFARLVQIQRLGLEKQLAYLERWKTDVGPVEQQIIATHQSTIIFAQTAIKSCYLLNGGGLIALPAFVGLFEIPAGAGVIVSAIFFFVGLCLSTTANISAFHTVDREGVRLQARREWLVTNLNAEHNPKENPPEATKEKLEKATSDQNTAGEQVDRHRNRGLRCIYGAVGFFVAGALSLLVVMVV